MSFATIGALFTERTLQKFDSVAPQSDEATETEILCGLEDCQQAIHDLEGKLAALKAKHIAGMSPASKSANEILGHDLTKSLNEVREAHLEWQRRPNTLAKSRTRSLAKSASSYAVAVADLQMLEQCAASVASGMTKLGSRPTQTRQWARDRARPRRRERLRGRRVFSAEHLG